MKKKLGYARISRPTLFALLLGLLVVTTSPQQAFCADYSLGYAPVLDNLQAILGNAGSVPAWEQSFGPDGALLNPVNGVPSALLSSGGFEGVFVPEKISNGVGMDYSALVGTGDIESSIVFNGVVHPGNDLGNAYAYAINNSSGHLVLYEAVERLGSASVDSFVEFEFNQTVVQVESGAPWPMHGNRTAGDILIRVGYAGGTLSSLELKVWASGGEGGSFQTLQTNKISQAKPCNGVAGVYAFCDAPRVGLDTSLRDGVFDANFHAVAVPAPDSLLHIAVDVAGVLGGNVEFSTLQVRTPEDIVLGGFRYMGYWKAHQAAR